MKLKITAIITASLLLCVTSCKSGKDTAVSGVQTERESSKADIKELLANAPADWTTLQVPLTISTAEPVSFKAGAKVYMTRDSSIYMSFTVLGMEMAAIQITNDSVFGVDKMNKRYVAESIRSVTADYPVNVAVLQSLFMGQPFAPGIARVTEKNTSDFKLKKDGSGKYSISPVKQFAPFTLMFPLYSDNQVESCVISSKSNQFTMTYTDPVECLGTRLPQINELNVVTPKLKINGTLNWNWNKARFDNPSDNKRIKIKSGYQKVSALQLLKSFS